MPDTTRKEVKLYAENGALVLHFKSENESKSVIGTPKRKNHSYDVVASNIQKKQQALDDFVKAAARAGHEIKEPIMDNCVGLLKRLGASGDIHFEPPKGQAPPRPAPNDQ